jgi:hypothetical protein
MKKLLAVLFVLTLTLMAVPAMADTAFSQQFNDKPPYSVSAPGVNTVEVFMETSTVSLVSPKGISGFPDSSWSETSTSPTFSIASGSVNDNLNFTVNFANGLGTPFTIDFYALYNGAVVDSTGFYYDGKGTGDNPISNWSATALATSFANENTSPVPEPASLMLLGSGLLGMAGMARRKLFPKV